MTSTPTFNFHPVFFTGNPFTNFLGINDLGEVTGFMGATTATGFEFNSNLAFSQRVNPAVSLAPPLTPAAVQLMGVGINNLGTADGIYIDANGVTHGWISGVTTNVDAPNTAFNQLLSINDAGTTVGYSSDTKAGQVDQKAYMRSATGTYTYLTLPVNFNSQATGTADSGEVVGFFLPTQTTSDGFALVNGTLQILQFPGSTFTQALGVNNAGTVVGFYNDANGNAHGFEYNPFNGTWTAIDVPSTATQSGTATVTATTVNSINDEGVVSGFFTDSAGNTDGFTASPVISPVDVATVQTAALGILRAPLSATAAASDAAQIDAGTLGLATLEMQFISQAAATTTPALIAFDWFFGTTPASSGLDSLTAFAQSLAAQGFSTQNVWVNLGASFAQNTTWGSSELAGQKVTVASMSTSAFIAAAYQDVFGIPINSGAQTTFANSFAFYSNFVQTGNPGFTAAQVSLSAKGAIGGLMLSLTPGSTNVGYGKSLTDFYTAAETGSQAIYGVPLRGL